jgi:hypothetical protein
MYKKILRKAQFITSFASSSCFATICLLVGSAESSGRRVLHAHVSPEGQTTGPLVAAVQRHNLTPSIWSPSWESGGKLHSFLISEVDGDGWSLARSGSFIPKERITGIHWTGGWVGIRAAMDVEANREVLALAGNLTPVVQSTASHFTSSRDEMSNILLNGSECWPFTEQQFLQL